MRFDNITADDLYKKIYRFFEIHKSIHCSISEISRLNNISSARGKKALEKLIQEGIILKSKKYESDLFYTYSINST